MDILIEDTHSLSMSGPPKDDATYEPDDEGEDKDTEDAAPQVTLGSFLASQNKTLGKYPTHSLVWSVLSWSLVLLCMINDAMRNCTLYKYAIKF